MLLFPPAIAIAVIAKLEDAKVPVLGLDGFKIFGEKIQPSLEQSMDLSKQSSSSWDLAKKFLADRMNSDLFFEIIADE